jgi:predicted secreted protein
MQKSAKRNLLMVAMLGMLACTAARCGGATQPNGSAGQDIVINADQDGKTVPVQIGGQVRVELAAQMGTGYSWQLQPLESNVAASGAVELVPAPNPMPGGPEMQVFHLRILSAGTVVLHFEYRQPWNKTAPPAKTFTVTLQAQ